MTLHEALPPFRTEIEIERVQYESAEVIILRDPLGISEENLMLDAGLLPLLDLLDGEQTLQSLVEILKTENGEDVAVGELAALIEALDDACLLNSEKFFDTKVFRDSDVRHAVCAGSVYPAEKEELHRYLDNVLAANPSRSYPANAKAIVVPHIDFRVDPAIYAAPFLAIRESDFNCVIHIGTSHYGWQDRFILSDKDYMTPLGMLRCDKAFVSELREGMKQSLTTNDIAHMPEHSLELHHVFLQHLFPDRDFTIVPILVTSFHDLVNAQREPNSDKKIKEFCDLLRELSTANGRRPLWLVSGDLAHIGRRFGDSWDAHEMLDTLRSEDYEVMDAMIKGKADRYFSTIATNHDRRRICGLPPVWTMLNALKPGSGTALDYNQWNDAPTGTAVSFGSAAWW